MYNNDYVGVFGKVTPPWSSSPRTLNRTAELVAMSKGPIEPAPSVKEIEAYFKAINEAVPTTKEEEEGFEALQSTQGRKFDSGKPDYTLLPFEALEDVVKVLGFGAVKYGRDNWQKVERQRYVAAAFRHLVSIAKGEEFDEESGQTHAAHLACCALFLGRQF